MDTTPPYASDVAFTPSVKAVQARKGSRASVMREWRNAVPGRPGSRRTSPPSSRRRRACSWPPRTREGQPYIQHRGGPAGFLRVLDDRTLGFVDFAGNRQFITQGNLADNPKAHLFLIDYAQQRRVKIWGEARVVEGDAELIAALMPDGYKARPEQVIVFTVAAWDANCPQHIPQRFEAADVAAALAERDKRIRALEVEVERLREAAIAGSSGNALRHRGARPSS